MLGICLCNILHRKYNSWYQLILIVLVIVTDLVLQNWSHIKQPELHETAHLMTTFDHSFQLVVVWSLLFSNPRKYLKSQFAWTQKGIDRGDEMFNRFIVAFPSNSVTCKQTYIAYGPFVWFAVQWWICVIKSLKYFFGFRRKLPPFKKFGSYMVIICSMSRSKQSQR